MEEKWKKEVVLLQVNCMEKFESQKVVSVISEHISWEWKRIVFYFPDIWFRGLEELESWD